MVLVTPNRLRWQRNASLGGAQRNIFMREILNRVLKVLSIQQRISVFYWVN